MINISNNNDNKQIINISNNDENDEQEQVINSRLSFFNQINNNNINSYDTENLFDKDKLDKHINEQKKIVRSLKNKLERIYHSYTFNNLLDKINDLNYDYQKNIIKVPVYYKYFIVKLKKNKDGFYQKWKHIAPMSFLNKVVELTAKEFVYSYLIELNKHNKKYSKLFDKIDAERINLLKQAIRDKDKISSRYINLVINKKNKKKEK